MFSIISGSIFFVYGLLLALNFKRAAERTFEFYSRFTPVGTATPKTLRIVGCIWVPIGASAIMIEILK